MVLPVHIGIHNHAVDRLAKNRTKDTKLLDTKLSEELTHTCLTEAEFSHLLHVT